MVSSVTDCSLVSPNVSKLRSLFSTLFRIGLSDRFISKLLHIGHCLRSTSSYSFPAGLSLHLHLPFLDPLIGSTDTRGTILRLTIDTRFDTGLGRLAETCRSTGLGGFRGESMIRRYSGSAFCAD